MQYYAAPPPTTIGEEGYVSLLYIVIICLFVIWYRVFFALCARAQNQRTEASKHERMRPVRCSVVRYMLKSSEYSRRSAQAMILASGLCGQHVQNIINALLCSGTAERYSMQQHSPWRRAADPVTLFEAWDSPSGGAGDHIIHRTQQKRD